MLLLVHLLVPQLANGEPLRDVEAYAEQLSQQRLFAGMLLVNQGRAPQELRSSASTHKSQLCWRHES